MKLIKVIKKVDANKLSSLESFIPKFEAGIKVRSDFFDLMRSEVEPEDFGVKTWAETYKLVGNPLRKILMGYTSEVTNTGCIKLIKGIQKHLIKK